MPGEAHDRFAEAARFHGHICPGLALGYRAAGIALERLRSGRAEGGPQGRLERLRPPRLPVDIDVDEEAFGRRGRLVVAEQADLVAHRGGADPGDPQPGADNVREGEFAEILVVRYDQRDQVPTSS